MRQKSNALNCFTQTHFIGQYAIDSLIIQASQPIHTLSQEYNQ